MWLAAVAALNGCGGGGGSSADSSATAPAPAPGPAPAPPPASGWQSSRQVGLTRNLQTTEIFATPATLDESGRGWVAWSENAAFGGCSAQLWVARLDGGAWSPPQNLAHATTGTGMTADVLGVDLAANANGEAALVWRQRYYSSSACTVIVGIDVWVRPYVNGAWQLPERVSAPQGGNSSFYATTAKVAIDSAGRITVAWVQQRADGAERITPYASRYEGGTWQAPRRLNAGDRDVHEIAVGQAGNGDVVFAWTQDTNLYDPGQSGGGPTQPAIWSARHIAASSTWSSPVRTGSTLAGFDGEARPRLAVGAGGHAVLAWERQSSGDRSIYGARFDPSAAQWSAAVEVDGQAGATDFPSVAINASGQAQIAWQVRDPATGRSDGYTTRWNAGAAPQPALAFESRDTELGIARVGIDDGGRAVLAWAQGSGIFYDLRARHVFASGMGEESLLQSGSGGAEPAVAVNARGHAIVALPRQWADSSVPSFNVSAHAVQYLP